MKKTLTTGWESPENDNECSCVINDPMLSQYRVDQYITTGKTHNEHTRQSNTQQSKQKHVRTQYISNHRDNSKIKKIILKT